MCLIPSSAHGTNAASAVLAGMKVVVVACDEAGNVDLDDLRAKIEAHADQLSALMITYPSTHGVYEHEVLAITQAVHDAGGQVYVDGANLNALLGFARFGDLGGDVSHLNLHKTFAIPHGGGGPGVGPVAAKAHLAPYLPGHPFSQRPDHAGGVFEGGPVSAAPHGSAGILPISWAYLRMMGAEGLRGCHGRRRPRGQLHRQAPAKTTTPCCTRGRAASSRTSASSTCVRSARRRGSRSTTSRSGSSTTASTLRRCRSRSRARSWSSRPSPRTSPEIERFIDAMIAIKAEAEAVAAGEWPADDNPLVNAPHTAEAVVMGEWTHPYTREQAVYPVSSIVRTKYWPPVRRIDQAYGDRNLVCACPPVEAFA